MGKAIIRKQQTMEIECDKCAGLFKIFAFSHKAQLTCPFCDEKLEIKVD